MKKTPLILLLAASLLLSACGKTDSDQGKSTADSTTAAQTDAQNEPALSTNSAFAELMQKYPVVSEPTDSFAAADSSELLDRAFKKLEETQDGIFTVKASVSMNLGGMGDLNEEFSETMKKIGDAYQSITEETSVSGEENSKITNTVTYVDGYFYYQSAYTGDEENAEGSNPTNKYKIQMSLEKFEEYLSDNGDSLSSATPDDLLNLFKKATEQFAGMTQEGGCSYFAKGISTENLNKLLQSGGDSSGILGEAEQAVGFTDDCLSNVAAVITLDKNGQLSSIYLDLPLDFSMSEGGISISMAMSVKMEITVSSIEAGDTIKAPADADSYKEIDYDEFFGFDDWDDFGDFGDFSSDDSLSPDEPLDATI